MGLSSCILSVSKLNSLCNNILIEDHINYKMSLVSCLPRLTPFFRKVLKLIVLYALNIFVSQRTFNCGKELLKSGLEKPYVILFRMLLCINL